MCDRVQFVKNGRRVATPDQVCRFDKVQEVIEAKDAKITSLEEQLKAALRDRDEARRERTKAERELVQIKTRSAMTVAETVTKEERQPRGKDQLRELDRKIEERKAPTLDEARKGGIQIEEVAAPAAARPAESKLKLNFGDKLRAAGKLLTDRLTAMGKGLPTRPYRWVRSQLAELISDEGETEAAEAKLPELLADPAIAERLSERRGELAKAEGEPAPAVGKPEAKIEAAPGRPRPRPREARAPRPNGRERRDRAFRILTEEKDRRGLRVYAYDQYIPREKTREEIRKMIAAGEVVNNIEWAIDEMVPVLNDEQAARAKANEALNILVEGGHAVSTGKAVPPFSPLLTAGGEALVAEQGQAAAEVAPETQADGVTKPVVETPAPAEAPLGTQAEPIVATPAAEPVAPAQAEAKATPLVSVESPSDWADDVALRASNEGYTGDVSQLATDLAAKFPEGVMAVINSATSLKDRAKFVKGKLGCKIGDAKIITRAIESLRGELAVIAERARKNGGAKDAIDASAQQAEKAAEQE